MIRSLLHTPEGVRDIYNEECSRKLLLQGSLQSLLKQYGYHAIETPTFEFFDIFGREVGTTPSKDLYKFFDREGNTLALRPDITPSVARSVTKYFSQEEMPIRLWYQGNTFINNSSYQGRLKETTQLGAELIGDDSVDADAEIVTLVVNALKTAGLKEFQVSIGHVDFLKGLEQAAKLSQETRDELELLISNKNFFGVEELVASIPMSSDLRQLFSSLGVLFDHGKDLAPIRELAKTQPVILAAVERLMKLYETLELYGTAAHVSLELGMISTYRYYTGIIFSGYTFGSGEPVVKGGRYDDLLPYFGKEAPSIGFAIVVDQLLAALSRQKIAYSAMEDCLLLVYQEAERSTAIAKANQLRESGAKVLLTSWQKDKTRDDYQAYGTRMSCTEILFLQDEQEVDQ